MDSFLARLALLSVAAFALGILALGMILATGQSEPTFYSQSLQIPVAEVQAAHREFEKTANELERDLTEGGRWEAEFTEAQLNGWLATEIPTWLADRQIKDVEQPRLQLDQDRIQLACRWHRSGLTGVVVLDCRPKLDATAESLSLEFLAVRSGWLPITQERWLKPLTSLTGRLPIPTQWELSSGTPTLHLFLKDLLQKELGAVSIESLKIAKGRVTVAGSRKAE